jgi:enoyl-[acyl-carrier protein] reductase I
MRAVCCLQEVGNVAAFLVSPLSSAITGHCCYVDNGLNIMGLAMDSKTLDREASA